MATIRSSVTGSPRTVEIKPVWDGVGDGISVQTFDPYAPGGGVPLIIVRRDDFVAAVEAELKAKVVPLASLPGEPILEHNGELVKSGSVHLPRGASADYAESLASHYLALAAWLRDVAPVRAKEEALEQLITAAPGWSGARWAHSARTLAADLIATGKVEVRE